MRVSDTDREAIRAALLDTLTTEGDMERLVQRARGLSLDRVALGHDLEQIVDRLLDRAQKEEWTTELLAAAHEMRPLHNDLTALYQRFESPVTEESATGRPRVFLSYKRDGQPDEAVAMEIHQALEDGISVFIDQDMPVGTRWPERLEAEVTNADFLIVLLSADSTHSEMVQREIQLADRAAQSQGGRPVILPVRLNYREPFPYPINQVLNPINWALWAGPADTPELIAELRRAIAGGVLSIDAAAKPGVVAQSVPGLWPRPLPFAQPILEMPEGTIGLESAFYVERPADQIALSAIARPGVTITIKGPRQMGKSSLLNRIIRASQQMEKEVAFLDFQLFERAAMADPEVFFRQFSTWISDTLGLESRSGECWEQPLSNTMRATKYVETCLLQRLEKPLTLAMDEVDRIFEADLRSDFFAMLRTWHNYRATKRIWTRLDLVLVTSTEPYLFIESLTQSPFNVGQVIDLTDFTLDQVADLNRRHDSPLSDDEVRRLFELVGGHPYLVRRALYLVASEQISAGGLFLQATEERGPFGDHLRSHLSRLYRREELARGLREVLEHQRCQDEQVFFRLRGAGLVRREGRTVVPRCRLYAEFFRERLDA